MMKLKDLATLLALALIAACNSTPKNACSGSLFVGSIVTDSLENWSGSWEFTGTSACNLTVVPDAALNCSYKGTFVDSDKGAAEGILAFTLTSIEGAGCSVAETLPHTYEWKYEIAGGEGVFTE